MSVSRPLAIGALIVMSALVYLIFGSGAGNTVPDGIVYGNGRIEAVQVDVSTRIAGRVKEIAVKEGDLVKFGETVAVIDSAQLQAQQLRAQADIASAESQVAAAEAAIAQARARLVFAQRELERAKPLVEQGHTSREAFDTRLSNRDVASANLAAAKATLISRKRGVDAARAAAAEIQTQIDDCTLKAPTIGRVLYRLAEPGEVLGPGGKVMTLVNLANVYMEFFLPAAQAHRLSIGGEARIKLDILDFAIPATVSFVSPKSQFTPKQVETPSEREKLMFRIKVRVPPALVRRHIDRVKTGVRGVAYVRLRGNTQPEWPEFLKKLPSETSKAISANE